MTKPNSTAQLSRANFNVPTHLWQRFEEVANANHRSRSEHLRFLMSEAVKQHDEANKGIEFRAFVSRVEEFVTEYAWHTRDCAAIDHDGEWHRGNPDCTCGYDDAREKLTEFGSYCQEDKEGGQR